MKCIECGRPAEYARYTQFSGIHYYCKEHAEQEDDFMKDQAGYSYWGEIITLNNFRKMWAGRTFKCKDTEETFTIPEDVYFKDFYSFGNCFVDVGTEHYARFGGNIEEISLKSLQEEYTSSPMIPEEECDHSYARKGWKCPKCGKDV